jgi:hypothetical protein
MRSPNALKALSGVAIVSAVVLRALPALADDKLACNTAYDQTQTLRRDGKLQAARVEALVCLRDVCADFVRADCTRWLGEIEAAQPSVVFEVQDTKGNSTSAVRVSLDGQPWLNDLDGKSRPIDPGQHAFRFELDGATPIEQTVQIVEGDRNRKFAVSFAPKSAPVDIPKPAPPPASADRGPRVWPWILGASGIVASGVAIGLGAGSAKQSSAWHALCPGGTCPSSLSKEDTAAVTSESSRAQTLGVLGGVLGGLGAATIGVSIYGIASAPKKAAGAEAHLLLSPAGARWQGTF